MWACKCIPIDLFSTLLEIYCSKGEERKGHLDVSVKFWSHWLIGGRPSKLQRRKTYIGECPDGEENWCCHWESEQSQVHGNPAAGQVWGECTSAVLNVTKTGMRWLIKHCISESWQKITSNNMNSSRLDASGVLVLQRLSWGRMKVTQKRKKHYI